MLETPFSFLETLLLPQKRSKLRAVDMPLHPKTQANCRMQSLEYSTDETPMGMTCIDQHTESTVVKLSTSFLSLAATLCIGAQ